VGFEYTGPPPNPDGQSQESPYPSAGYPPPYGYNGYGYPPVPPTYPGYGGSWPPYPSYPMGPPWFRRDGYQFSVAIISTICSVFVILAGIFCGFMLLFLAVTPSILSQVQPKERFSATAAYTALTIIGLLGGASSLYHSIRALSQKRSAPFTLPWSWLLLGFYVILLAVGFTIGSTAQVLANQPLTIFLIILTGVLPALTFLALAVRRVHYPKEAPWATSWRRFTLAIVSGGTLTVLLAIIFELVLTKLAGNVFGVHTSIIDNINMQIPHDPQELFFLIVLVSVIAPLIEESIKPLAVLIMLGRLRSAAEAFVLGFACGIGFDLVETSGYISLGDSRPWVDTALERSTAGLLHGFGAGMVALGCYYLTYRNSINRRILIGIGCIAYAVIQHAIWNSTFLLGLLPGPVGLFFANGTVQISSYTMQGIVVAYLVESLFIFACFLFVTGKLRSQQAP
jgi:RsiW-degrading membrane proteinase PrsW (M82 family)